MLNLDSQQQDLIENAQRSAQPLDNINQFIDLTRLQENDDVDNIKMLCQQAVDINAAAVCVYPQYAELAKSELENLNVNTQLCCVANFPTGDQPLELVTEQIKQAIVAGADEIDVVFPYQAFLAGNIGDVQYFLHHVRDCVTGKTLKVILESGIIDDAEQLMQMSKTAIMCGTDFLKTSTGKVEVGASLQAAVVMLQASEKYSDGRVGFKASGGVRTQQAAAEYAELAELILGEGWVKPECFRVGASRLLG